MYQSLKNTFKNKTYLLYLLLTILFYGNTIKNKYSLDDDFVTVTNFPEQNKSYVPNNELVAKGFKGIPKIWRSRYAHDSEGAYDYRPVVTTSFAIEYAIFKQNPYVSHLINILFYFLCICLIDKCVQILLVSESYKKNVALLCSLFFLVHPLHTEVVASLKSRDEILCFFFSLMTLVYSFKFYKEANFKNTLLIILFLSLGILSKKTALTFIFIIPLALYFFRKLEVKKLAYILLFLTGTFILIKLIEKNIIEEKAVRNFAHFENSLYGNHINVFHKIVIALKCLGFYVKMLLVPFPLCFYYGETTFDLSLSINIYIITSIIFLILIIVYYFKTKNKYFLFSLLFFLSAMFPFLNFITPVPGIIGERLAFTASFGFSLLVALIFINFFNLKETNILLKSFFAKPLIYLSILIFVCLIYTVKRNNFWYDRMTLYEHDIKYMEHSAKGNSLLGLEYYSKIHNSKSQIEVKTNAKKALKYFIIAVKADSSIYTACNNAGVMLFSYFKDYSQAAYYFKMAIKAKPNYTQAIENLGNTYKMRLQHDSAILCYKKAIDINPHQYNSWKNLEDIYMYQKMFNAASQINDSALIRFPNDVYFIQNRSMLLKFNK